MRSTRTSLLAEPAPAIGGDERTAAGAPAPRRTVLVFYPHNPSAPRHGSHLRALQQLGDLAHDHAIVFASTERTSDTPWPRDITPALRQALHAQDVFIFERSAPGRLGRALARLCQAARKLEGVAGGATLARKLRGLQHRVDTLLMAAWFARLRRQVGAAAVVVHYTPWAHLTRFIDRRVARMLELHDLLPINDHLAHKAARSIREAGGVAALVALDDTNAYVDSSAGLPEPVRRELAASLAALTRYDRVWTISEREEHVIRELQPAVRTQTIYPIVRRAARGPIDPGLALLPIGPNPFNTYSLLRYFALIAPAIELPPGAAIQITGQSWRNLGFDTPAGTRYVGLVDDYRALLASARFMIVPTILGTGQQMKIFEALAHGVPAVCYDCAAPRNLKGSRHGVLAAQDDREFAAAINRLWHDDAFYRDTADAALAAQPHFTVSQAYRDSLHDLLHGTTGPGARP